MRTKLDILIVEDDDTASYLMQDFLENCNFNVDVVSTVTDGISYLKVKKYDLLLLDLSLPDFSGFDLLSSIHNTIAIPTIVISAYNDTSTKVQAFKYGANDYICKPIDFLELEARIWALLSRKDNIDLNNTNKNQTFVISNSNILFHGTMVNFTSVEFSILKILIENINNTISRDYLVENVESVSSSRLLDNHIKNIRKKLDQNDKNRYIKTEYGVGLNL